MKRAIWILIFGGALFSSSLWASQHIAPPVRVDVRTSFGGRLAAGVEFVGTPSGGEVASFDTTGAPDGWRELSCEGYATSICIRNDIGVLGGRLPAGVATEFAVSTNLIRHNLVVPSGSTARFPFGTILKFSENTRIVAESGALLDFRGVALVDALNDSVGGDSDLGWVGEANALSESWVSASGHSFSVLTFVDRGNTFGPALHWTAGGGSSTYGTLPQPHDDDAYHFAGWFTASIGGEQVSAKSLVTTGPRTLYARWTANVFTLLLDHQGGSGGTASAIATYDSDMPAITVPKRTGYTFAGYYDSTADSGTQYYTASGASARTWDKTAATTLYAKWTANTYTVTLNRQNGSGGASSVSATYGSAMPTISVPTRTGYTFGGYYTSTGGSGTQYYTSTGASARTWDRTAATTLYAKWTANTYAVTLNRQNGSGGASSVSATYGSAMPTIAVPTREGYTFGGYYTSTGGSGTQYYTSTGASARTWDRTAATTLYAKWTANTYTVTLNRQNGTGGTASVTATYGSAMPSIAVPMRTGYTFGGYFAAANGGGIQYYTTSGTSAHNSAMTADTTLYAKWTANFYDVALDPQGGNGGTASVTAIFGSPLPSIAVPTRIGFTFDGYWDGANGTGTRYLTAAGTGACDWDKPENARLYAKWVSLSPVYRFYSPRTRGHFFTINEAEKDNLIATASHIWNYEGIAYYAYKQPVAGTVPLYRFYAPGAKGHFYTRNEVEKNNLIATASHIWNFEGIAYYVAAAAGAGTTPIYRFWAPGAKHHFYTRNEGEKNNLIATASHIWNYEGIAFHAWPSRMPAATAKAVVKVAAEDGTEEEYWTRETSGTRGTSATNGTEGTSGTGGTRLMLFAGDEGARVPREGALELKGGVRLEARSESPDAEELAAGASGNEGEPVALRLALPDGRRAVRFWSATDGLLADEPSAEGVVCFELPANGVWHWLFVHPSDAEETAAAEESVWLRAE